MEYEEWEPFYRQIVEDFGFSQAADEASAQELDRILGGARASPAELRALLRGGDVTVAGNAPSLESELDAVTGVVIAADEAASVLRSQGIVPAILVTDLDGEVEDQLRMNEEGTIAVVHGHGDNTSAVRTWAPRFRGRTMATTQSQPTGGLHNFGGFTDGDRAAYLADHFGAASIRLVGFDFEHPSPKDANPRRKQKKLDWAYILLQNLDRDEMDL